MNAYDLRPTDQSFLPERLSHALLQSGLRAQRELEEALAIVERRSRATSGVAEHTQLQSQITQGELDETAELMEADLETYARQKGIWIENTNLTLRERYGDRLISGSEGVIYLDCERGKVIKAQSAYTYHTIQEKLDALVLHNALFPDTAYTLLGFGLSAGSNGEFQVVVEQDWIRANAAQKRMEIADVDAYMRALGFHRCSDTYRDRHNYTNGFLQVRDLHEENIFWDENGNVAVIDNIMRFENSPYFYVLTE